MDPVVLATETPGYTPADIKYLLNETLRYALFAGRRYMTYRDFQMAKPEHEMGLRSPIKHMTREAQRAAGLSRSRARASPFACSCRITASRGSPSSGRGQPSGMSHHFPARDAYQGMQTRDHYSEPSARLVWRARGRDRILRAEESDARRRRRFRDHPPLAWLHGARRNARSAGRVAAHRRLDDGYVHLGIAGDGARRWKKRSSAS